MSVPTDPGYRPWQLMKPNQLINSTSALDGNLWKSATHVLTVVGSDTEYDIGSVIDGSLVMEHMPFVNVVEIRAYTVNTRYILKTNWLSDIDESP